MPYSKVLKHFYESMLQMLMTAYFKGLSTHTSFNKKYNLRKQLIITHGYVLLSSGI